LDGSQEPRIFYESIEIEQKTSVVGIIPVKILFHLEKCTKNKNGKGR